jgi:hypothetical protein
MNELAMNPKPNKPATKAITSKPTANGNMGRSPNKGWAP